MLLEAWRDFEREDGDEKSQAEVQPFTELVCLACFRVFLSFNLMLHLSHTGATVASQESEEATKGAGRGWKRPGLGGIL